MTAGVLIVLGGQLADRAAKSEAAGRPAAGERSPPAAEAPPSRAVRVSFPGLAEVRLGGADSPWADRDGWHVVQNVYGRFSRYTETAAGDRVEIALDDFRTVERRDLGSVALYPDLATLGSDWRLVATPYVSQPADGGATVRYHVEWLPTENLAERPDTAAFLGKPVAQMTELLARRVHGDRSRTLAITSYRVALSFDGHAETYRAAFRWLRGADGRLRFSIVDVVVHGLTLPLAEPRPPAGRGEPAPEATASPRRTVDTAAPACVARRWPTVAAAPTRSNAGAEDHLSGEHRSLFAASFDCSCDAACVSRCAARVVTARCEDVGLLDEPGTVHRVQGRAAAEATAVARGDQEAAECLAALDCYVERCLGAECGEVTVGSAADAPPDGFTLVVDLVGSHRTSESNVCGRCATK